MKKIIAGVLSVTLVFGSFALPAAESGITPFDAAITADAEVYGDYSCTLLSDGTIEIVGYVGQNVDVEIPRIINGKKVTRIGDSAFESCENLNSVTIPDSISSIGESAFRYCYELTSITIPDSVNSIGANAFCACHSLTSITIPDGVTVIDDGTFSNCFSFTSITIPDSVISIGDEVFSHCDNLQSVTIPKNVTNIGKDIFLFCYSLASINVDKNNSTFSSVNGVLFSKDKTRLIQYPAGNTRSSYSIPNGTKIIGNSSFENSKNLTSVTIPNSVSDIEEWAFFRSGLEKLMIPSSVSIIRKCTFYECLSLVNVTIPDSIKTIENGAFDCCINLKEVTIPKSVTSIGVRAFGYYLETSLRKVANFKIKCCYNSAAEKYAKENLFDYEYIDCDIPTVSAVSVTGYSCTTTAVRINWNKVKNASGYRVYRQNPTTKKWEKVTTLSGGDTLTYRQSGLKSGTEYIYKVKAYLKSGGKTYWGVASEAFHTVTKPSAVKITKISKSSTAVRFYWKEIKCEAYEIEMYNTATKMWENVGIVHSSQSNCRISGLKKNKSYKFRLRARSRTHEAMPWERFGAWTEATVRTKK